LRGLAVACSTVAALGFCTATAGAQTDDGKRQSAVESAAAAYRSEYPEITPEAAADAAAKQEARKALYEQLAQDTDAFGGAWFDARNGVVHVAATNDGLAEAAVNRGAQLGLQVKTHEVERSAAELERQAAELRAGNDALGGAAEGQVGIDVETNKVIVAVSGDELAALQSSAPEGVALVEDPELAIEEDIGCVTRTSCDSTIRAGAVLWHGPNRSNSCSAGFTARTVFNTRYVYTAGHCSNGNGETWGTGSLPIGPMSASRNLGAIDAAIIRVTNPWFANDRGGEIFRTLQVNGVAPTLSYIVQGELVCLSANFTQPSGGNLCGVIGTNSDAQVRGMVRVNGLDGCPGDSGGGWYWRTSTNRRIAYGLHSRSNTGCHVPNGRSWFSAMPTIKSGFTPGLNVEVIP
jgi:streptogrisin C